MEISAAYITKPGGRKHNEDYADYLVYDGLGCYVVADGLGGHRKGDLASQTACQSIISAFKQEPGSSADHMTEYLRTAGLALENARLKVGLEDGVKTTLVLLLTGKESAIWAHLGDSRLYYFRNGKIFDQTKDHSLPQRLADIGEISQDQIRSHEDGNRLLSVFDGPDISHFSRSCQPVSLSEGDAFLLCSDGFWDYVYEEEMERCYIQTSDPKSWLEKMESKLLSRVEPGHDNYTALAVRVN